MSEDPRDPPIEEMDFLHGLTVVDIGDYRVSRGLTRRPVSTCRHMRMTYDPKERRIWCRDCEQDVGAFEAFVAVAENYDREHKALVERQRRVVDAEKFLVRSLAAKWIDKAWRSRTMVPACPHCNGGLFPDDFKKGVAMVGRDFAKARKTRRK